MIRMLKTIAAAGIAALGIAFPAAAVTNGTDFTDLWWNPSESGWGLNVIHQNGIIFATLYVYDSSGIPHFYSASETRGTGNAFTGPLYETHGTYFALPYNASALTATPVGNLSLTFSTANSGTLNYSVGTTNVSKSITRFSFATDNLAGNYLGGLTATSTCSSGSQATLIFDQLRVTHNGSSISMTVNFFNNAGLQSTCTYSGTYAAMGRQGTINGTYTCNIGGTAVNGSFAIANVEAAQNGFNGRFTGSDNFCSSHTGYFGGVRDVL